MNRKTKILGTLLAISTAFGVVVLGNSISMMSIRGDGTSIALAKSDIVVKSNANSTTMKVYDAVISNGSETSSVQKPNEESTTTPTVVYATVTTDVLNVRSGPSTGYSIMGTLSYGSKVEAIAINNGWIKIKYGTSTGYICGDYATLSGKLNEEISTPSSSKIKKIVLDAGHGGTDCGAIGPSGYYEKTFTLSTTMRLKNLLENNGYSVIMTRTTDVYLTLAERTAVSNNSNADLFISIHANSFNEKSNGIETFSYQSTGTAADIAKLVQKRLVANLGLRDRGHKTEGFYVLKYNKKPAILLEAAFISNPAEETLLKSPAFQEKVAKSVIEALAQY